MVLFQRFIFEVAIRMTRHKPYRQFSLQALFILMTVSAVAAFVAPMVYRMLFPPPPFIYGSLF